MPLLLVSDPYHIGFTKMRRTPFPTRFDITHNVPAGVAIVVISLMLGACAQPGEVLEFPNGMVVREPFLSFYSEHGGQRVFGYPVSLPIESEDGVLTQCFQNVCMEYHPDADDGYQVRLTALGSLYTGGIDPAVPRPERQATNERYYPHTGHIVRGSFLSFYVAYGGPEVFGYPLTEQLIDQDGLIYQCFERACFYWDESAPNGQRVKLIPLGQCATRQTLCLFPPGELLGSLGEWEGVPSRVREFSNGFRVSGRILDFYEAFGDEELFGPPLDEQRIGAGAVYQIFENVVIMAEGPSGTGRVHLAPLGRAIAPDEPPQPPSDSPYYFQATGFEVDPLFADMFVSNGGASIFGYPITSLRQEGELFVQYFENVRFEWDPGAPEGQQIRLGRLGVSYMAGEIPPILVGGEPEEAQIPASGVGKVTTWVSEPVVSVSNPTETFYVRVTDRGDMPLSGAQVTLVIYTPDGPRSYPMPQTDEDGLSMVTVDVSGLPPTEFTEYDVIVTWGVEQATRRNHFLMWY